MKSAIKTLSILALTFVSLTGFAQNKLFSAEELINKKDPAWPLVKKMDRFCQKQGRDSVG